MGEPISSSVVGKVVDLLCGVAIKEIGYMWNSSENVKNLKSEVDKLSGMKGRIQQQMDLAKSKGEHLKTGVEEWMKEADAKISEATEFINEEAQAKKTCFNVRWCVNLSTFRHYGRMAIKKKSFLLQHQEDGKSFETCVSLPARPLRFTDTYDPRNLENIYSQKSALKKIIEAVKDDTIQIVGITGLGGVGKTTLASEVATKLKDEFVDVFIPISKTVNKEKIEEKVQAVSRRIMNGDKVLIILDDVWEELKLEEVGIPCGSDKMNCKILLTSRRRDVCVEMNAQQIILVNPLEKEEAWALFERGVCKREWDDKLKQIALQIVEECGGLPLFVQAVAKALKDKEIESWEAALNRLKAPIFHGDVKYKEEGILQLKLSYDYLEDEVAKSCFLLCSMFPEDATIGLERLTYYGLGLGMLNNPDSNIHDTKHRVQAAVDALKSSFLLLPEESKPTLSLVPEKRKEQLFKMHDLVRDMAMLITSEGNDKFWVRSGTGLREWQPKKHLESYKKISLMGNKICKLPDHVHFPYLDTFLIQDNELSIVHEEFFRGMEKLKVLDMSGNNISSLPQSLKYLTILCLLDLSGNNSLCEISILGELTCLEILKLRSTGITIIPEEIGQLLNLRLLDVYDCEDLSYVAPGVISKLIWLEELYVGLKKGNWEFLKELSALKSLKILHLLVPELHYIPEDFPFETLIEFRIMERISTEETDGCRRILQISQHIFPFPARIMKLIQLSEKLKLWRIKDLDNILPNLYPEGFDDLKYIGLVECHDLRSLFKARDLDEMQTSNEVGQRRRKGKFFSQVEEIMLLNMYRLEVLWESPHKYISFGNLVKMWIDTLPSLLKLFPLSVAKGLVKLRELSIWGCESLVVVISAGEEETGGTEIEETCGSRSETDIVFPQLTVLHLLVLQNLESFYSGHSNINYPSLKFIDVFNCPNMKRWSYGDNHIPKLKFELERRQYSNINDYIAAQLEMNGELRTWDMTWADSEGMLL